MEEIRKENESEEKVDEEKEIGNWKSKTDWPPMIRFVMYGGKLI